MNRLCVFLSITLIGALMAIQAWNDSTVYNENGRLASGVLYFHTSDYSAFRVNPPLMSLVGAIAVLGERAQAVLETADELAALPEPERLDLKVINARFAKPLDTETLLSPLREGKFLLTVEEGILAGGFGSALLEAACDAGVNTQKIRRLGIGDTYTPHGSRDELLALIGLDKESLRAAALRANEDFR